MRNIPGGAHLFYAFFQAHFKFHIFFQNKFLLASENIAKSDFLAKNIPGGLTHVSYEFFQALFRSENIIFIRTLWPSGDPFLKKIGKHIPVAVAHDLYVFFQE